MGGLGCYRGHSVAQAMPGSVVLLQLDSVMMSMACVTTGVIGTKHVEI